MVFAKADDGINAAGSSAKSAVAQNRKQCVAIINSPWILVIRKFNGARGGGELL
jgi:hypothetical protein